jgi:hypothetical protein
VRVATPVTPAGLEKFLGHDLSFSERGSFCLDGSFLIDAADAPGGGMVREYADLAAFTVSAAAPAPTSEKSDTRKAVTCSSAS